MLGAIRDGGLIPYDADVDVLLLVDTPPAADPAALWPLLGEFSAFMHWKGHAVHQVNATGIKVFPPKPHVDNIYHEHRRRAAERSTAEDLKHDMGELSKIAKAAAGRGDRVLSIGRNVVDLEFAFVGRGGKYIIPHGGHADAAMLLPTRVVKFGPLAIPAPRDAEGILDILYPAARGKRTWGTRVFRKPHGGLVPVPLGLPRLALPS